MSLFHFIHLHQCNHGSETTQPIFNNDELSFRAFLEVIQGLKNTRNSMIVTQVNDKGINCQYSKVISALKHALKPFPEIKIITIFGSFASKRLRSESDLDIAVAAKVPLSYDQKYEVMKSLVDSFSREIDLIDLQSVAGPILQEALCTGIIVKKDSVSLFYQLLKKMWINQADMMPLTRMIIHNRCERFVLNEH